MYYLTTTLFSDTNGDPNTSGIYTLTLTEK